MYITSDLLTFLKTNFTESKRRKIDIKFNKRDVLLGLVLTYTNGLFTILVYILFAAIETITRRFYSILTILAKFLIPSNYNRFSILSWRWRQYTA